MTCHMSLTSRASSDAKRPSDSTSACNFTLIRMVFGALAVLTYLIPLLSNARPIVRRVWNSKIVSEDRTKRS